MADSDPSLSDAPRAARRGAGRPRKSGAERRTYDVRLALNDAERARLYEAWSVANGQSGTFGAWVRQAALMAADMYLGKPVARKTRLVNASRMAVWAKIGARVNATAHKVNAHKSVDTFDQQIIADLVVLGREIELYVKPEMDSPAQEKINRSLEAQWQKILSNLGQIRRVAQSEGYAELVRKIETVETNLGKCFEVQA